MSQRTLLAAITTITAISILYGCSSSDAPPLASPPTAGVPPTPGSVLLDKQLRALIDANQLSGDPSTGRNIPPITDPLARLGMKLFFSKAMGGEFDAACVSCHHPVLGGADGLSLPVGVGAIDPDLLGPGRGDAAGLPNVPRHSPTVFNVALWDSSLFWDSRVESLGKEAGANGAASGISTPDSGASVIDAAAGANLVIAQARFPVTSVHEMRGAFEQGSSNRSLRSHLAARIGNYGIGEGELSGSRWLAEFQAAFQSAENAEDLITFDNITAAIGAYQRSMVFVDSPWSDYVRGDLDALSIDAKRGAVLFFTPADQQGAGCAGCHSGDLFSDERHHATGTPQFGPGKGNPDDHDFGRENTTGSAADRFRFRTPSLLNVAATAPYMHSGAYETLQQVLRHYDNPRQAVDGFFDDGGWCTLQQYQDVQNCESLYPTARQNSGKALEKMTAELNAGDSAALPTIELDEREREQLLAFLMTLTDPCIEDRACMAPWIPDAGDAPDDHQLNAVDVNGAAL